MQTPLTGPYFPADQLTGELSFVQWVGQLVSENRSALVRTAMREGLQLDESFDAVQDAFATFIERSE